MVQLRDHVWAKKKWSLSRVGLLIEVKMHSCWDMTRWSLNRGGLWIQVVARAGFNVSRHCLIIISLCQVLTSVISPQPGHACTGSAVVFSWGLLNLCFTEPWMCIAECACVFY